MRSTWTPVRVTQVRPLSSPRPRSAAAGSAGGASFSRSRPSSSRRSPSAASRPSAPKKSIAVIWASRALRRASCAFASARRSGGAIVAERRGEGAELLGELLVILVARSVEQGPDLLVGEALDEPGLADDRLAAALHDLAQEPLEVLLRLGRRGQRVDGVLDRDRADALEPPPDLDPQVGGLGRQLMDQQQPARGGRGGAVGIGHSV